MRAGAVSAAAVRVQAAETPLSLPQHCSEQEYAVFVNTLAISPAYRRQKINHRRRFIVHWPDLADWFAASLAERVGRLAGEDRQCLSYRISYLARGYLVFLGLRGHACLDYDWLLGVGYLYVGGLATQLGLELDIDPLVHEAVRLGFDRPSAYQAMRWAVSRIALHTGDLDPNHIRMAHIEELLQAVRQFGERSDIADFYGSTERYRESPSKAWITHLHQLQVVLFHRGQIAEQPRKAMPSYAEQPPTPPRMQAVVDRWLAVCRLTDRPATVCKLELTLRCFLAWLAETEPTLTSLAEVTRDHLLAYLTVLTETPSERTGRPLAVLSRRGRISTLARFFRDTAEWEWDEVPGRPLLGSSDVPKIPARVPRFIPADELDRLMTAIARLACPYQRAALLVARWSGARQGEIRRLAADCLDSYPDGTPRLRLPAGKTYRERMVPLHEEAAQALREVIALRADCRERAFTDELTGVPIRYLFMDYGKLLSTFYLFETPLQKACKTVGLVDASGRGTVSAHRFRHTVGTQLAERGAKLHTIMSVLGHRSVSMALVYAQISDPEVLRDYKAVLGPGALIAGPGAEALRNGALPSSAIDWLKCNFFKTELELGHCLRLPAEGPCECDLYLSCAKFVTTPAYAPRLRERHKVELALVKDAEQRGWLREVERHRATAARIEQLLTDLGEPLEEFVEPVEEANTPQNLRATKNQP
jgi:integrase